MQLNVMNFETQKFDTIVPQAPYDALSYESYIGVECNAFPTWLLLDAQ